jgi:hypothetical protein
LISSSFSQYYFEPQSLHETLPSTTLSTGISQNTSQYYFVQQSLHKTLGVISVSHASLFVGLVLAWAASLPAQYVNLIAAFSLETFTRITIR